MRTLVAVVAGVSAVVFGGVLLLFVLPGAFVQHPQRSGLDYCLAVLGNTFTRETGPMAGAGLVLIFLGIVVQLRAVFPDRSDSSLGPAGRALLFWGLAAAGVLTVVGVLVAVTLVNLGHG